MVVGNHQARLNRVKLEFEDGYTMILTGESLRTWEENMLQGQRLRLMVEQMTQSRKGAGDGDISDDRPKTLLDVILDDD